MDLLELISQMIDSPYPYIISFLSSLQFTIVQLLLKLKKKGNFSLQDIEISWGSFFFFVQLST